ncbi:hypothetical protein [Paraburkholderia kururiensis]|uniref:hypothetical protein n=1 Tax=Paraburkholderia kururiensis TaxID=984307 RepID=UPI0039A67144
MPALLVKLNPPPAESELIHFHAKILRVSERPPNLVVRTDAGDTRDLRFPTPLYTIFSGKASFLGLSAEQEASLPGCDADIYGANVRYLWPATFRVWKIDCAAAPVSYRQIADKYRAMNSDYAYAPWLGVLFAACGVILMYIGDRNRRRK